MLFGRLFQSFTSKVTTSQPAVYSSLMVSAGTVMWGAYVVGRKVRDNRAYGGDMSAVTGDSPVVREARFRVYDMDEHLSCRS